MMICQLIAVAQQYERKRVCTCMCVLGCLEMW